MVNLPESLMTDQERMVYDVLKYAMDHERTVTVTYDDGSVREVEVHAIGNSRAHKPCARVWQVGGPDEQTSNWRMLLLQGVVDAKVGDHPSLAPRDGYKPGDRGMIHIFKEL